MRMIVLSLLIIASACGENSQDKKMKAAQLEAMRAEAARVEAMREQAIRAQQEAQRLQAERMEEMRKEAEKARLEQEAAVRRQEKARDYARRVGQEIMNAIGSGQDLIVNHNLRYYDATAKTLEIAMEVSFNGAFFRSNHYQVSGVLTVNENGHNPRFARQAANQKYLDQEKVMIGLGVIVIAGGAYALSQMGDESTDSKNNANTKPSTKTLDILKLELCNGLGAGSVYAAYSFNENGRTYTTGWYSIKPDECEPINSGNFGKEVIVFAMSDSRTWSGGKALCVDMKNKFKLRQSGDSCADGLTAQSFFAMKFTKPGNGHMKIHFDAKLDTELEQFMAGVKRN